MSTVCQVLCRAEDTVVLRQDPDLKESIAFAFYLINPLPFSWVCCSLQSMTVNGKLGKERGAEKGKKSSLVTIFHLIKTNGSTYSPTICHDWGSW